MAALAERALGLRALARAYGALADGLAPDASCGAFAAAALRELDLSIDVAPGDRERIPSTGGCLVVANHPTGMMEGLALLELLGAVRADVKVLANRALGRLSLLRPTLLAVEVFDRAPTRGNAAALREAVMHVRRGGCLLTFPAGEVASKQWWRRGVVEPSWAPTIAGLQRLADVPVVAVHVAARNGAAFHAAGLLHPRLRTLLLVRALLAQRGAKVRVGVSHPIQPAQLARFGDDGERIGYLRLRCDILARRRPGITPPPRSVVGMTTIAAPAARPALASEIAQLPAAQTLVDQGHMQVLWAHAPQIPHALREIGRLRELSFRAAGEGTGRERDLDRFDDDYVHLFVWDRESMEIVGAYRLGPTDAVAGGRLYTGGFYRFDPRFFTSLGPALELGRSFVQPRYQRGFLPLLLLWRGIGAWVAAHPRYRFLFGPVSISADHHPTSVRLMVEHLRAHCSDARLGRFVTSLQPWHPAPQTQNPPWRPEHIADLDAVAAIVRDLEVGRRGIPVLLAEYLKLGARLLGVNVDREFHTIDALVVVDLLGMPAHLQARYLGAAGMQALQRAHRPVAAAATATAGD